jgi:hypothetical protein
MTARINRFTILLAVLTAAGLPALAGGPAYLWAGPQAEKFEDLTQFNFAGGVVSGTGVKDKGGFTVIPLEADKAQTKLAVSFALKEEEKRTLSDFRVIAVDAAGKRHEAKSQTGASASGKGVMVVTLVAGFDLASDKVDTLVIQQRERK